MKWPNPSDLPTKENHIYDLFDFLERLSGGVKDVTLPRLKAEGASDPLLDVWKMFRENVEDLGKLRQASEFTKMHDWTVRRNLEFITGMLKNNIAKASQEELAVLTRFQGYLSSFKPPITFSLAEVDVKVVVTDDKGMKTMMNILSRQLEIFFKRWELEDTEEGTVFKLTWEPLKAYWNTEDKNERKTHAAGAYSRWVQLITKYGLLMPPVAEREAGLNKISQLLRQLCESHGLDPNQLAGR
ncbi:MAG: hypothetical protein HY820_43260 [Acidobacteria bacterium]|nr:hypothetical protein [Acidobacteriota bacterium]